MLAVYMLQKYYLRTSRQMRHLDLEAKSPLYRVFTEAAGGIATIRSFNWNGAFMAEHLQLLDQSQRPYYMLYCIQRWLNVVLDLFVAGVAVVLVSLAVELTTTATAGSIGLALLNLAQFNQTLSMLVNSWTGLETSLGAIARLKSFLAETPQEARPGEDQTPPENWPQAGLVEMTDVTSKYKLRTPHTDQMLSE
jgi:ATP-binding cassette subfamily C (CFTR/MRP) protein 1